MALTMSDAYRNAVANAGGALITHIGLVNNLGQELSGGGYARKAVSWTTASNGIIRPTADLTFDIPAGANVAGWKGFSALTGGTDYGGADLTQESYAGAGQYKLLAASTGIKHENP